MPNIHRRRRRDATVELSGVGGVNTKFSQLAHDDCRPVPSGADKTQLDSLLANLFRLVETVAI